MDVLFRLSSNIEGFENIEKTKIFFQDILSKRDDSYFFNVKRIRNIVQNDTIYFVYDGYIVARAIFTGARTINKQRDERYIYGHEVKNIQIIHSDKKLNHHIVSTRMTYIESESKTEEVRRVLGILTNDIFPDEIQDNDNLVEGAKKQVIVNAYERNLMAREQCIGKYGYDCFVCGLNFMQRYGEIGKNFVHIHHLKPLSEIKAEYKIDPVEDLRPVCPNCHAMLHMKNPPYNIDEIKNCLI